MLTWRPTNYIINIKISKSFLHDEKEGLKKGWKYESNEYQSANSQIFIIFLQFNHS